jgi:hypothetical protein
MLEEDQEYTEEEDDYIPYPDCPMCGGQSGLMGYLGQLAWFRCLFCGMEFNIPAND